MTPAELVRTIKEQVIDENDKACRDLFTMTDVSEANDEFGRKTLMLFNSLSAEDKETFFQIIRHVSIDTVTGLLGIFDNLSPLTDFGNEFTITDSNGEKLNGELQDIFIQETENA